MSFGLSRGKTLDVGDVGIDMRTLPTFEEGRIDPRSWFANTDAPLEIEIGSGKGTFLLQESQQRVEPNYLGFEWAAEFYRYAADRIRRNHSTNVKMVHGDATEFLRYWCRIMLQMCCTCILVTLGLKQGTTNGELFKMQRLKHFTEC